MDCVMAKNAAIIVSSSDGLFLVSLGGVGGGGGGGGGIAES